jgi:dolichol-phosphate mannosyltransferase
VVVDDNSPDGTGDVVARLAAADARVHIIRRDGKRGLGSAYLAAFRWALEREYALVAVMDADFSHAPEQVGRLLEAVEDVDVVVGSRYVPGGHIENWPLLRRALSAIGNFVARAMVGRAFHDWTSGFKCYRRVVLEFVESTTIESEGYAFQVEILFRCLRAGFKVREVPITFVDRRLGTTKMSRAEVAESICLLLRLAWARWTGAR